MRALCDALKTAPSRMNLTPTTTLPMPTRLNEDNDGAGNYPITDILTVPQTVRGSGPENMTVPSGLDEDSAGQGYHATWTP